MTVFPGATCLSRHWKSGLSRGTKRGNRLATQVTCLQDVLVILKRMLENCKDIFKTLFTCVYGILHSFQFPIRMRYKCHSYLYRKCLKDDV